MSARVWRRRRQSKRLLLELRRAIDVVQADPTRVYRLSPPYDGLVAVSFEYYQRLLSYGKVTADDAV